MVAGEAGAGMMGLPMVGLLAAFPALAETKPGAWEASACLGAPATVVANESVEGGSWGGQTWAGALAACLAAPLPQWYLVGWAGTHAKWVTKCATGIRTGVGNFFGYSRTAIGAVLDGLKRAMFAYDDTLPRPPAPVQ